MDNKETKTNSTKVKTLVWLVIAILLAAMELGFLETPINEMITWASASTGVGSKLFPAIRAFLV